MKPFCFRTVSKQPSKLIANFSKHLYLTLILTFYVIINIASVSASASAHSPLQSNSNEDCSPLKCTGNFECVRDMCQSKGQIAAVTGDESSTVEAKVQGEQDNDSVSRDVQAKLSEALGLFIGIPFLVFLMIGIAFCCLACRCCPLNYYIYKNRLQIQRPQGIVGYEKLGQGPHGNLVQYGASLSEKP